MARKGDQFETTFQCYRIVTKLGEGGSGSVYEVIDSADRPFALKLLDASKSTSDRRRRFKNEIAFCQKNNHPNIVSVLDHGLKVHGTGSSPFYIMPLYERTLRQEMEAGLNENRIDELLSGILDGVEAAHLNCVTHRDIKPENILISEDGRPILTDFGIARFAKHELLTLVETKQGQRLANFLYAAPEQKDRNATVDARADIYALGLLLNEMHTGQIPSGAGFCTIESKFPERVYLDSIVERMIAQDPDERYQRIAEIKQDLIGRRNQHVAQQRLDAARAEVVREDSTEDVPSLEPISVDYRDGNFIVQLDKQAPPGWAAEFHEQRGGHQYMLGLEPRHCRVGGDQISIRVEDSPNTVANLYGYMKQWIRNANIQLERTVKRTRQQEIERQRRELEERVRDAERRKAVLDRLSS